MIEEISHYTYRTRDGENFSCKKLAENHEKELELPAVFIVSNGKSLLNNKLVFSTNELAENYIAKHYEHSIDVEVVRCAIDYNILINKERR